jgi:uncharacterized YigZ family protein
MEDSYRTLEKPAEGSYRSKGSRFIAFGYPVKNEEEIKRILAELKKKYHDARHHCFAYRLGSSKDIYRTNDDGEPSGTAGKPIYRQILSHDLTDILIVVVRYFGGTLLGTGGLIIAYKSAAADMLERAHIISMYVEDDIELDFPYQILNGIMKILNEESVVPRQTNFNTQCSIRIGIRKSLSEKLIKRFEAFPGLTYKSLLK